MDLSTLLGVGPLFDDRRDAGKKLASALESERGPNTVVVGLARGGVEVAAVVARALEAPLDAVAVRKIGHPFQPEYWIGAVAPGEGVYLRGSNELTVEQLARDVEEAKTKVAELDRRLHAEHPPLELRGKTALLVDDGLATGSTMIVALRWAKAAGAARVVVAVPVAAAASLDLIAREASTVFCLHARKDFFAVGAWYRSFGQVNDEAVAWLIADLRHEASALVCLSS